MREKVRKESGDARRMAGVEERRRQGKWKRMEVADGREEDEEGRASGTRAGSISGGFHAPEGRPRNEASTPDGGARPWHMRRAKMVSSTNKSGRGQRRRAHAGRRAPSKSAAVDLVRPWHPTKQ